MLHEVELYSPGLAPTTMYEIRVPYLKKEVDNTNTIRLENRKEWAIKGCSILFDGWCDSVASKDIVNFLVNSPMGSVFLKSLDVSEVVKDSKTLFEMLDSIVEEIGEANVIQVVTDNASNYVKAGELLMNKRTHIYWTPMCRTLFGLDIGGHWKDSKDQEYYKEVHFHEWQMNNLRKMVTSEEWNGSKWKKDVGGKQLATYILQDSFWRNVVYALKLECQLHRPLHAAGYFLNPSIYYKDPEQVSCQEVEDGLYECIKRLSLNIDIEDLIIDELDAYKNASGLFGNEVAIRNRTKKYPASYQKEKPQARLNDLVYVKYNRALQRRYKRKYIINPILLEEIDDSNEWLMEKMDEENEVDELVFENDDLTWNVVSRAMGANEPTYHTRKATKSVDKGKSSVASSSSSRSRDNIGIGLSSRSLVDEDDVIDGFGEDEEMEDDIGEDKYDEDEEDGE
ncbi:hypothetical protein C2S53_000394 [Perilla frutescens var. hirtella]|uniref:DUF659 domain-containing protein n=1 Tax=Perilla frutescens var. hirtella TaxID=608512 RepID=A0AAD4PG85_PERFH|nr:hypothetical protein C2S53_000394 [Perilla frutescens var. hirtella]